MRTVAANAGNSQHADFYHHHTCGPKQRGGKSSKKRDGGREPASNGACGGGKDCTMPLNPPVPPVLKSCCKLLSLKCNPLLLVVLPPLPPPASGSPPCDLSWSCAGTDVERMIEIGLLTVRRTTPGASRFRRWVDSIFQLCLCDLTPAQNSTNVSLVTYTTCAT